MAQEYKNAVVAWFDLLGMASALTARIEHSPHVGIQGLYKFEPLLVNLRDRMHEADYSGWNHILQSYMYGDGIGIHFSDLKGAIKFCSDLMCSLMVYYEGWNSEDSDRQDDIEYKISPVISRCVIARGTCFYIPNPLISNTGSLPDKSKYMVSGEGFVKAYKLESNSQKSVRGAQLILDESITENNIDSEITFRQPAYSTDGTESIIENRVVTWPSYHFNSTNMDSNWENWLKRKSIDYASDTPSIWQQYINTLLIIRIAKQQSGLNLNSNINTLNEIRNAITKSKSKTKEQKIRYLNRIFQLNNS